MNFIIAMAFLNLALYFFFSLKPGGRNPRALRAANIFYLGFSLLILIPFFAYSTILGLFMIPGPFVLSNFFQLFGAFFAWVHKKYFVKNLKNDKAI